jgi:hypothetical protein
LVRSARDAIAAERGSKSMKLIYEAVRGRRFALACVLAIVASAIVATSASPRPQAHASDTLLQTINVPLDGSKVYSPPLVAGGVYRIVASGTYTQTGGTNPVERDALYCFRFDSPYATFSCSPPNPPQRQHLTIVRYEGDTSLAHDLDNLDPATTLAYNPLHTYQETFTAPSASRLEVFLGGDPGAYTYSGGIRLDLYLVSLPPGAGPPGVTRRLLHPATAWGQAGPATALAPGDEMVAPSPPIEAKQREASVTITGDSRGKIEVATVSSERRCFEMFIADSYTRVEKVVAGRIHYEYVEEPDSFLILLSLLACLEETRAANSAKHAVAKGAGAARPGCRVGGAAVDLHLDRASKTASWKVRPSRRVSSHQLLVSCRLERDGTMKMRVRTRSRHANLRKLIGPRLFAGVYRVREAVGTANIRATFKRR